MPMPRKSEAMHRLTGTKSQAKAEPEFQVPASRPRAPKDLSPVVLGVFKHLCALLRKRRALTAGDAELIRLYAIKHERHTKARAKIEEEGEIRIYTRLDSNGQPHEVEKENLWLKVATGCEKDMVGILDRLGLSPMNRTKAKPTGQRPVVAPPPDPMEELLRGRGVTTWENEDGKQKPAN
jgi:phage terminase small subunit